MHFTYDFSRFNWLYLLKAKSEVVGVFIQFKTIIALQLNHKIEAVQSDGGGEFITLSCPHIPQQTGLAKRKHIHLYI